MQTSMSSVKMVGGTERWLIVVQINDTNGSDRNTPHCRTPPLWHGCVMENVIPITNQSGTKSDV